MTREERMVGSRWLRRTATPAARRAASSKRDQPPRLRNTLPGQRSAGTRGGVIARVWRSTRQKLNRPPGSMWALTSEAAPKLYHKSRGSPARTYAASMWRMLLVWSGCLKWLKCPTAASRPSQQTATESGPGHAKLAPSAVLSMRRRSVIRLDQGGPFVASAAARSYQIVVQARARGRCRRSLRAVGRGVRFVQERRACPCRPKEQPQRTLLSPPRL